MLSNLKPNAWSRYISKNHKKDYLTKICFLYLFLFVIIYLRANFVRKFDLMLTKSLS